MNLPKINSSFLVSKYFLLSSKYKALLLLSATIALVVALSLTIGKTIFDQIVKSREEIDNFSQTNQVLRAKSQVLATIDENEIKKQLEEARAAVPGSTPTLPTLLSLRKLALENKVSISNFKVGVSNEKSKKLEIQLSIIGTLTDVLSFLDKVKSNSPVMRIIDANITYSSSLSIARIVIDSIYSSPVSDLGKIESPLEALKNTDLEIIKEFEKLTKLEESTLILSQPAGKSNPFE